MLEVAKDNDPFEIASTFTKVCLAWMKYPEELMVKLFHLDKDLRQTALEELENLLNNGFPVNGKPAEKAFLDTVKWYSKVARKYYTIFGHRAMEFAQKAPELAERERLIYGFWMNQMLSALDPANYFWTNPGAVQRYLRSKGESLQKGGANWLEDVRRGENLPKMADEGSFRIGKNMAATPGAVVFRNELMELIQYEPMTEETYRVPLVLIQPWINKYYIFDLGKSVSLVRYLVKKGFPVFITSWKNPTTEMRNTTFDDYLFRGALQAVEVACEICGAPRAHTAGYCIGGTALAALMAWLNRNGDKGAIPIVDWTLFAALVDFSDPGELGVFTGEKAIQSVEKLMAEDGYLDAKFLGMTFRLLRSNSLIWRYFVHNYLHGESLPKSDMLFWNSDSTRLPQAMCSFYLREFYQKNNLARKDAMTLGGRPLDLGRIAQPLYALGAQQDHISPWQGTFKTCRLVGGPVRYVLANEGHITGIVNPPAAGSKNKYWAGAAQGDGDPEAWLSSREDQCGSWWSYWVGWLAERSGERGPPVSLGSKTWPVLEKAPGEYVLEK